MDAEKILSKYPDKIPVIIQPNNNNNLKSLPKSKYLINKDYTLAQVLLLIRKKLEIKPETGIFMFVNGVLIPNSNVLSDVYSQHKSEDSFLYIKYTTENTFG